MFADVDSEMRIAQEEVFGPVLAMIPVSDFEEGLKVANGVDYGLAVSLVSNHHDDINRFANDVEAGVVKINEATTGLELHMPFGGVKNSSSEIWREQGDAGSTSTRSRRSPTRTTERTLVDLFSLISFARIVRRRASHHDYRR